MDIPGSADTHRGGSTDTHWGDPADVPPDVSDLELWLGAVDLAARHAPDPVNSKRCVNPNCSDPQPYPCFARQLADRSAVRSRFASGLDRADLRSSAKYRSPLGTADVGASATLAEPTNVAAAAPRSRSYPR